MTDIREHRPWDDEYPPYAKEVPRMYNDEKSIFDPTTTYQRQDIVVGKQPKDAPPSLTPIGEPEVKPEETIDAPQALLADETRG